MDTAVTHSYTANRFQKGLTIQPLAWTLQQHTNTLNILFSLIQSIKTGDQGTQETKLIQVSCVEKTVKATQRVTELYHAEVKVGQVQYISQEISARVIN